MAVWPFGPRLLLIDEGILRRRAFPARLPADSKRALAYCQQTLYAVVDLTMTVIYVNIRWKAYVGRPAPAKV